MGRINLGAGSLGPSCSVFSRLAGFGLQMWAWVGVGHSSRCVRAARLRVGTWAQEAWGSEGPAKGLLHSRPFQHPTHSPQAPGPKKGSGFKKTPTQELQSPKAYASLHEQGWSLGTCPRSHSQGRQEPQQEQRA